MGSFVPSKASICVILNFVERGKCNTSAVNRDSVTELEHPWRLGLELLQPLLCG